jgi:predicted aspartyl protease
MFPASGAAEVPVRILSRAGVLLCTVGMAAIQVLAASRGADLASVAIPFQLERGHLVIVQGALGELTGRRLVVDTGSSPTILDARIAQELKLQGSLSRLELFNGSSLARTSILPSLTLGPVTAKSLPVLVSDLSFVQRDVGIRIDAIIGLDVLRTSFVIDYEARLIRFGSLPALPGSVPFESAPPLVTVIVQVQGQPARVLVDTGASGLLLFRKAHRFDLLSVKRSQTADNLTGPFEREQVEVSDLRLGSSDLGRRIAYLANARESVSRDYDGLMGIPALGIKQIAFDFERGLLSWK